MYIIFCTEILYVFFMNLDYILHKDLIFTVSHFPCNIHYVAGFQTELVRLKWNVTVSGHHLRTVPLFVQFLVRILRGWRFCSVQPSLAIGFRSARKYLKLKLTFYSIQ